MHINLAKSAGFCFGVKRALDIAYETASTGKNILMLGDIVHNEEVVKEIEKLGIKKINRLKPQKDKLLLIRAHGASKKIFFKARDLGYKIIDATCPMVKEIHRIASMMEKKGYKIIVIGDRKHDEVQGIIGQLKQKAKIIENIDNIHLAKFKNCKKACVIVQSTQNFETVTDIVSTLRKHIPDLKFFNTICKPTRTKQAEINCMPLENDIMIIIGSRNSANTKRLFEISKKLNPRTYWVNSKEELRPIWFKGIQSLGITAGASTPVKSIQEITKHIKKITHNLVKN